MSFVVQGHSYQYVSYLGSGGKAAVHLVRGDDGVKYAAKISTNMPKDMIEEMLAEDPDYKGPFTSLEQIEEEARIMSYVNNKLFGRYFDNIVFFVASATLPNDSLPTAMQNEYGEAVAVIIESYVDGPTIQQMIDNGVAPDMFKLVSDLLSALYTLDSIGVVYLDLAPENIIYDEKTNNFVLIDFDDVEVEDPIFNIPRKGFHPVLPDLANHKTSARLSYLLEILQQYFPDAFNIFRGQMEEFRVVVDSNVDTLSLIRSFSSIFSDRDITIHAADRDIVFRSGQVMTEIDADQLVPNPDYETGIKVIRDSFKQLGTTLSHKTSYGNYAVLDSALSAYQTGSTGQKRVAKELLSRYKILKRYSSPEDLKGLSIKQLLAMLP